MATSRHDPHGRQVGSGGGASRVTSATVVGVTGRLLQVRVEHDDRARAGRIVVVGPNGRIMEQTRDRVRAGLVNAGFPRPGHSVTTSFPPSFGPTPGSSVDLAVAAAVLASTGMFSLDSFDTTVLIGEMGLDGRLRPVRGVLPMVTAAATVGTDTVVVPADNASEARLVPGVRVVAVDSIGQFAEWASTGWQPPTSRSDGGPLLGNGDGFLAELAYVPAGMSTARWALEVAAAGGHHLGMVGPPETGIALLAECLPTLLPHLDDDAAYEVTALRSIAGLLPPDTGLLRRAPLRAPHHTTTVHALIGGGPYTPYPGEVSLAHHGVLLLDDAPQFGHRTLDAVRATLDTGDVRLAGTGRTVTYPARFQLVLAAQPCPCATPTGSEPCTGCTPRDRNRYRARITQIWQRTDIRLRLRPLDRQRTTDGESSATVAARVTRARQIAADRWATLGYRTNAEVPGKTLRSKAYRLPAGDIDPLLRMLQAGALTDDDDDGDRVLRLAFTASDLRGSDRPGHHEINAAIDLHINRQP